MVDSLTVLFDSNGFTRPAPALFVENLSIIQRFRLTRRDVLAVALAFGDLLHQVLVVPAGVVLERKGHQIALAIT